MNIQEIQNTLKDNLLAFSKVISPQTFYLESPDFHYEIADYLMNRKNKQVVIQAPRGSAKSSLSTMFILHHLVYDEGDKLVVIQSKTRPEAINRLSKIKNILDYSKNFRQVFDPKGYMTAENSELWREDKIKIRTSYGVITLKALGTGQQVRGALEDDTRITLYLLDDPDDEDNTKTKESMDYNFDKFLGGVAGLDVRNGRVIVIGTPIRQGCIVDKLMDASNWLSKKYQAYNTTTLEVLWEGMYSYQWLMDKKKEWEDIGKLSKFYSEYMCEIVGDEDRLFRPEDFRYYEGEFVVKDGLNFIKIDGELKPVNVHLGIDPASSTKQSADYSVIMPVAYDESKNIYVLDYFRKRVTPLALVEAIVDYTRRFNPVKGHVESVGYQEMLRQRLRERLQDENLYLSGLELKLNPRTEKNTRLESLQPFFAQHRLFMKSAMQELIDELLMYPRGRHDDLLDGLYYATRKLIVPDHTPNESLDDEKYFSFKYLKNNWVRS